MITLHDSSVEMRRRLQVHLAPAPHRSSAGAVRRGAPAALRRSGAALTTRGKRTVQMRRWRAQAEWPIVAVDVASA